MDLSKLFIVRHSVTEYVYTEERKLFDAQGKGEGYLREFSYPVTARSGKESQDLLVRGVATCTASFGFNTWIDWGE